MGVLSPRDSADYIVKNARDVTIDQGGICKVADVVLDCYNRGLVGTHAWRDHPLHPKVADDSAAQWIFLVDALNFNFWSKDGAQKYAVRWNGTLHTGYFSLCAAVVRALEEGVPLLNAEFCSNISSQQVEKIFRSDTNVDIPLLKERHQVLQEWGHVLSSMYDGSFANCIRECKNSCQALLKNVVENFTSFQDEGTFDGVKVSFYKRAQILVADLWSCFDGKGLGHFEDIGTLTAFADYRVPQVLAYFGALQYSTQLSSLLTEGCLLESGSREEMEIRGATIHACELVREELRKKMQASEEINSILVDYCLWDYRRKHANEVEHTPFHRVRCIYY
ncbi:queuosine salvage protein isoform X2 [Rhipicephalus sanguineus]|nr:queuosine salvage protein isoform X2 [Rhipicephalus sanguineus]XP_037500458.1 queuosine salvage protein isoform X2 [Rhipicephalus sanguineus]XP_037500475.1 queuosine salvage protein isoform X2 [Rhipicephalus sanguineus]